MPNRLEIDPSGSAADFYLSLDPVSRESLDTVLERIRQDPEPDGSRIVAISMPPAFIYYYSDGTWQVSYSLSWHVYEGIFVGEIMHIGYA